MNIQTAITPYVHLLDNDRIFNDIGFYLKAIELDLIEGNWLRLHVRWFATKWEYIKYVQDGGKSYSYNNKEFTLEFKTLKYRSYLTGQSHTSRARLNIGVKTNRPSRQLTYTPEYFDNIKYGVNCYFSPKNFNTGKHDISLFKWDLPS